MKNQVTAHDCRLHRLFLAILLILVVTQIAHAALTYRQDIYWDLRVYHDAVMTAGDPYADHGGLRYIYHPLVLEFMRVFGGQIEFAMMTFYVGCAIVFALGMKSVPQAGLATSLGVAFSGLGIASIATGNLTPFLHLALLGLVARGSAGRTDRAIFLAAVALSAIVKPYMLAYAGIPLMVALVERRQIARVALEIAVMMIVLITVVASYTVMHPIEFHAFLDALRAQTSDSGDLGYSLFSRFVELSARGYGQLLLLHLVTVIAVSTMTIGLAIKQGRQQGIAFAFLIYFLCSMLNPRLKDYDLLAAMIALFVYCLNTQAGWRALIIPVIAFVPPTIQLMIKRSFILEMDFWAAPFNVYYSSIGLILLCLFLAGSARSPSDKALASA